MSMDPPWRGSKARLGQYRPDGVANGVPDPCPVGMCSTGEPLNPIANLPGQGMLGPFPPLEQFQRPLELG